MEFKEAWVIANNPKQRRLRQALTLLARFRNILPGFVFVDIPANELNDRYWQVVVDASKAMCPCGTRRIMGPHQSLREPLAGGRECRVTKDQALLLGPRGGDIQTTLLRVEMGLTGLLFTSMPFAPRKAVYRVGNPVPLHASIVHEYLSERSDLPFDCEYDGVKVLAGAVTYLAGGVALIHVHPNVEVFTTATRNAKHVCP